MMSAIEQAAEILRHAKSVAVLSGAGVSAESGVPTFRASDGLWEGHRIEDVATPDGYERDPALVWRFYNGRRVNVAKVKPNRGHDALAAMEKHFAEFTLATQNVDGLHQTAGNKNVLELHGSLRRTRCLGCSKIEDRGLDDLGDHPACPHCAAPIRPDIVWFGEMLPHRILSASQKAAERCDVFLVVGTSALVYPAAGLIPMTKFKHPPGKVLEFNLEPTAASDAADVGLYGPSGETLPEVCALLGIEVPPA
jgi:NAD-dependent deacetylase